MLISVDIKKKKKTHNTIQSKYFALELVIDRMGASEMARIHPDFVHQIMQPLKYPLLHYDIILNVNISVDAREPTSRCAAGKVLDSFLVSLKHETDLRLYGDEKVR